MYTFQESNAAGKVIVVLLFAGSIFAWSVMLSKWREMVQAKRGCDVFLRSYRKEADLVSLFLKRQRNESPMCTIYEKACTALGGVLESAGANPDDLFMGGVGEKHDRLGEVHVSAVRNVAERTMADQALLLENSMGFIATAASTAPFLGLLGTVWGVMDSFSGMAVTGENTLRAVAPGISGALLTTVVGLLVALPSAIGYNMLSDAIRRQTVALDSFQQELMSDIEREYLLEA
jgi:biopolymer transport protein ExbB/TolQ